MKFSVRRRDSGDPETEVPALSGTGGSLQRVGLMPPLCKPSGSFCPQGYLRRAELVGPLPAQSTALPHQGGPSAYPQDSSLGPGVLTALRCALVRVVPAVVGAVAETTLCQAGASVAAALLGPAGLLPDLWGGGTHVSKWLVPRGHGEHCHIIPWVAQGTGFFCPPHALARAWCPKTMGALSNGRAPLGFAPHPVPPRSQLTSQQMWDSPGKPQFLNMMSSSATSAPQVGGCVREKMSCDGRMRMA